MCSVGGGGAGWWLCVRCALNDNGGRWRWGGWCQGAMYLCVRRAGSHSRRMHGACTRIRRCSHVDHIFRTDVVVAIDLFDYVTRAKHSLSHTHTHSPQMKRISTRFEVIYGYLQSPLDPQVLSHCRRTKYCRCRAERTEIDANINSQQQSHRFTGNSDDSAFEVNIVAFTPQPTALNISTFITLYFVG